MSAGIPSTSAPCPVLYMLLTSLPQARLCVFLQRSSGSRTSKPNCKGTNRSVCVFSRTKLELKQHHFFLILLVKAQSERGLGWQKWQGQELGYRKRGVIVIIFLPSIISYRWDAHASRFAQERLSLFLLSL